MKLFEYQGKEVFARAGIPVPESRLVTCAEREHDRIAAEAAEAAHELGGRERQTVVVKAQLDMGGRGKAGLIRMAADQGEAAAVSREILAKGYRIPALLVERAVNIERELYLSLSVDPQRACFVFLASAEGGVDIESLARERPDAIRRVSIDPFRGLQAFQGRALAYDLGLRDSAIGSFTALVNALYAVFRNSDAELAEINPLFLTADGELIAGDSKLIIDDNSLYRQSGFELTREQFDSDIAYAAALDGIPYVQFDGEISLMCAGAGLATTVFDLVNFGGGSVANYLEFGGPNYHKAQRAMELCLRNRSAVILIVTFGTIARADVMAQGIVDAIAALKPDRPVVTCIRGTNEERAHETLRNAGLEPLLDTEEAVRRAIDLAAQNRGRTS